MGWCVRMSDAIRLCFLLSDYGDGVSWMEKFAGVCGCGDSVGKFRNFLGVRKPHSFPGCLLGSQPRPCFPSKLRKLPPPHFPNPAPPSEEAWAPRRDSEAQGKYTGLVPFLQKDTCGHERLSGGSVSLDETPVSSFPSAYH